MLVQPLNDARLDGPMPYSVTRGLAIVLLLLIAPGIGAVRTARECCQEIGLCLRGPG